jgi:pentatricopeptide repeat protein
LTKLLDGDDISNAQEYVASLPKEHQHHILFAKIISALVRSRQLNEAAQYIEKLVEAGQMPGLFCFNSLVAAFAYNKQYEEAELWLEKMTSYGVHPTAFSIYPIIRSLGRSGKIEEAERIFYQVMPQSVLEGEAKSVSKLIAGVISAYHVNGMDDKAIEFFDSLPKSVRDKSGLLLVPQSSFNDK